jgi:ABC-type multidrug transport system fused ATPase/permease subunit
MFWVREMPIQIIDKWAVSIRPCELNNFAKIFGPHPKIQTNSAEYKSLMTFLTESGLSLLDIVELSNDDYVSTKKDIVVDARVTHIFDVLDKCRTFIQNNRPGSNVLRYLLHCFNNRIIRRHYNSSGCGTLLGNLNLDCRCTPFDRMPFYASLKKHNPRISSVFECIDSEGREHELFAKLLWNNVETKGKLYTPKNELPENTDTEALIKTYNTKLYLPKHKNRIIEEVDDHLYIKGYEKDTVDILNLLIQLSDKGLQNYSNSVNSWLQSSSYVIDCDDKKGVLSQIFENSKVALIYGSAGTGKTTLINHISNFFKDRPKLFLANYNPAVANLERMYWTPFVRH